MVELTDAQIDAALPGLAKLTTRAAVDPKAMPLTTQNYLWRRVLAARFRLGTADDIRAVAKFAARSDVTEAARTDALGLLEKWPAPSNRDPIVGVHRPIGKRDEGLGKVVADTVRTGLPSLMTSGVFVRKATANLAAILQQHQHKNGAPELDAQAPVFLRHGAGRWHSASILHYQVATRQITKVRNWCDDSAFGILPFRVAGLFLTCENAWLSLLKRKTKK